MTPDQYIQSLQVSEPPTPTYEVDNMSDDELFCLDLLDKVGADNITDEELQQALENAKANENLYSKQVASLRVYYKELEEKRQQELEAEKQAEAIETEVDLSRYNLVDEHGNPVGPQKPGKPVYVDLRHKQFRTIDPFDCRDMDDAVYTEVDEDGNLVSQIQEHLYATVLFIGANDNIDNYIEVEV